MHSGDGGMLNQSGFELLVAGAGSGVALAACRLFQVVSDTTDQLEDQRPPVFHNAATSQGGRELPDGH